MDDPSFVRRVVDSLGDLPNRYPQQISGINASYWRIGAAKVSGTQAATADKKHAVATIALRGDDDTEVLRNYRTVQDAFRIPGVDVQVGGLEAVAGALNDTVAADIHRMELLAFPAVGVLLFFVFGGVVAAALPLIVGAITVFGAFGIVRFLTDFTEVNSFVSPVVSMIGLGLAIDYGLFIVSRFREELAEGYDTPTAVRRTVMTAGRTVVFSATMIIGSLGGIILFPQGFLKSIAYGAIATVSVAALVAITVLPAILAVLGPRVDMLGIRRFGRSGVAPKVGPKFWERFTRRVMRHPVQVVVPLVAGLALLILPVHNLAFGGFSEKYLPPDNSTRLAQEQIDAYFPHRRSDPIELVFVSTDTPAVGALWKQANRAPGLAEPFGVPVPAPDKSAVYRTTAVLTDSGNAGPTIDYLRSLERPGNVEMYVGGVPAQQKDSLDTLQSRIPGMVALVMLISTVLMFLAFGSLILPIKAALMSVLGLGSTLGILTWIFIDGHGASLLGFTPQPIQANMLVVIMAIIYGLSTDYEVLLLSRMVEARARGASTAEAIESGTAQSSRVITAAALILFVVVGAFAFSDLVMMQYIAYGMIAALLIDATVPRLLLVPATMKLLGDDSWWAPAWMKRIQRRLGLGEPALDETLPHHRNPPDLAATTPITDPVTVRLPVVNTSSPGPPRPRSIESECEPPTVPFRRSDER
ncbi:MMPL family transporter [Nocardia sp. alder85J]|uniref:MMPL family transporter n=1 Tax=Nocardia sp. alder85J TaxID=2862949 RepID=UPI002B1CB4F8|nr:MMPL family transporter [Nocardia sp. alder85J]